VHIGKAKVKLSYTKKSEVSKTKKYKSKLFLKSSLSLVGVKLYYTSGRE